MYSYMLIRIKRRNERTEKWWITCAFININSANTKHLYIKQFLNEFNIDILGMAETWGKDNYPPIILEDYNCVFKNRKGNGGGTAILIKKRIKFSLIEMSLWNEIEDRIIGIQLNNKTNIFCVYAPVDS